ncbi:MAG: methyltransferase domain-containing protein [Candidatus Aquicultorales bacterium]
MQSSIVPLLICPACGRPFDVSPNAGNSGDDEFLTCSCGGRFPVVSGVPRLIVDREDDTFGFTAERLAAVSRMERGHFWFEGRRRLVDRLLAEYVPAGSLVADIGCGTGSMVDLLNNRGYKALGMDLRPEGLRAAGERGSDRLVQADVAKLPCADSSLDAVLALDVLEHVEDEAAVLSEVRRVLKPGGVFLLTVPAIPSLWSPRDIAAGHLRRYSRAHLGRLLSDAEFNLVDRGFYQRPLLPLVVLSRAIARISPKAIEKEERPGPTLSLILTVIAKADGGFGRLKRFPGSSLYAVCRRG